MFDAGFVAAATKPASNRMGEPPAASTPEELPMFVPDVQNSIHSYNKSS